MTIFRWQRRVRRIFYGLRTEGEGLVRESLALGVGVFIGCTPFYGFHLLLCWVVGWMAGLNRLKLYLAANISNPLFSPILILSELQTGAWVRRAALHDLTLASLRQTDPWTFAADLLVGSTVIGGVLGTGIGLATYATGGIRRRSDRLALLWQRASDPYLESGITSWEFARGKLRGDPIYRVLVAGDVLPGGGTLLDLGCGQGLALAALVHAGRLDAEGRWPGPHPPPRFDARIGVEIRPRVAHIARSALGADAVITVADASSMPLPRCRAVLLLDMLHMVPADAQDVLVGRAADALEPGGVILIREADAAQGAGFAMVRLGNRLKALAFGHWRQRFYFRQHAEWKALLERHGFAVRVRPANEGTPFANLLLCGTRSSGRPPVRDGSDLHQNRTNGGPLVVLPAEP